MRRFNTRDVLVVAIMQAAVIAVGVLLVGRWDKRFLDSRIQAPFPVAEFADYGLLSLAIPLAWILLMLRARLSPRLAESAKRRAFVGGLVFVLAMALLFVGTVVRAWFVYGHTIDQIIDEWTRPKVVASVLEAGAGFSACVGCCARLVRHASSRALPLTVPAGYSRSCQKRVTR